MIFALLGVVPFAGSARAADFPGEPSDGSRIVHYFHFNERPEGNLEELPRYWEPLRQTGFPRFAIGGFDFAVGHLTPVSFRLSSNGRNVAYLYNGPETMVREDTDYRIVAHVRPDHLDSARACFSAMYLDRRQRPLLSSLVRSPWIGAETHAADWVRVELFLPAAPADAHTIGLGVWVMQESSWNDGFSAKRQLSIANIRAGVWVDDITVYALPFVSLTTNRPGHILDDSDRPELHVVLADRHDQGLVGRLVITDAAGRRVEERNIPSSAESPAAATILDLSSFRPGVYEALLDVRARDRTLVTRTLRFARLAAALRFASGGTRAWGITLDPAQRDAAEVEDVLVRRSGVQALKLPLWSGRPEEPPAPETKSAQDRWLQRLLKDGFQLTGVFAGPPAELLRGESPYTRPLLDLLSEHPAFWEPSLGAVVAPYASTFRAWQIGSDDAPMLLGTGKLIKAVDQLTSAMRRYVTAPYLIAPVSAVQEVTPPRPDFDHLSLRLPAETDPGWLTALIAPWREVFHGKLSVSVPPLSADRYERSARLADWAQRLIAARHSGVETVFVPQPWSVRSTVHGPIAEPREEYLVLRTLADMLGDAQPAQHIRLSPTAHLYAFSLGSELVLAGWDAGAPGAGRTFALSLGGAERCVDLYGVAHPLPRDARNRALVRLSPQPVLMDRVDPWLIDLYSSFALTPVFFSSSRDSTPAKLRFDYRAPRPLTGAVHLRAPKDWDLVPRQFDLNLLPHRAQELSLTVGVAHNAPAGRQVLRAELTLSDGTFLDIPLTVEFGLADVEAEGMAWLEGDVLHVRHEVTNRSGAALHFRGSALVPGRERQYRPMNNLQSGEKQRVEYRFREAAHLVGAVVRLELRETNDGPRTHTLELRVP